MFMEILAVSNATFDTIYRQSGVNKEFYKA